MEEMQELSQKDLLDRAVALAHENKQLKNEKSGETNDPIVKRVMKMLNQRSVVGVAKYKETLAEDNRTFTEWLTMLQEELLDAANYIEKLKDITKV